MSSARRFKRRLDPITVGGKQYEAGELTRPGPIEDLGPGAVDETEWFECRYCGKLAGRVSEERASVFGDVFHVTPSCQQYRVMSGREYIEANVGSPRVKLDNLDGKSIGAMPELPKGD